MQPVRVVVLAQLARQADQLACLACTPCVDEQCAAVPASALLEGKGVTTSNQHTLHRTALLTGARPTNLLGRVHSLMGKGAILRPATDAVPFRGLPKARCWPRSCDGKTHHACRGGLCRQSQ